MRRLLILSASAGAGHMRAAEAVLAACRERWPDAEARHVDVLTLTPAPFRRLYGKGYLDFVNKAPELVGMIYDRSDRPPKHPAADRLRLLAGRLNTRPLVRLLREFDPDVVCHTHFLPAEIVAHQRRKGRVRAPHAVVVTDFDVHRFWLCKGAARYFVARDENRVHLQALGEPADAVRVTGIPIHPDFGSVLDLAALRAKHALEAGRPLLLVLCGGFGVGPIESLVESLTKTVKDAQLVVVAGRNEALRKALERRAQAAALPTRVLGFTTEMHEWMAVADLAVTKPGGLTTSEALALGLPIVVANAIPGQETRNATMLFEAGAAISGENPLTVGYRVAQLLASPERLRAMRAAARSLGRPRAAAQIAEELGRLHSS
jgi:processive 1,2-diacylglycerol beta-glucosyltransferase